MNVSTTRYEFAAATGRVYVSCVSKRSTKHNDRLEIFRQIRPRYESISIDYVSVYSKRSGYSENAKIHAQISVIYLMERGVPRISPFVSQAIIVVVVNAKKTMPLYQDSIKLIFINSLMCIVHVEEFSR